MSHAYVEDRLREVDKSWNVMTIAACMMQIMGEEPDLNMLDFENAFRNIGSKTTYLVAWPKSKMPQGLFPVHLDGAPADYGLWICVNGENDMLGTLLKFGLSYNDNINALRQCGWNTTGARHPA